MPSKTREVRERQVSSFETSISNRLALLKEKGADSAQIKKDPKIKHLRARLARTKKSLVAISKLEQQKEALALRKKEKAENPPEKQKKGKSATAKEGKAAKAQKDSKKSKKKQ